MKRKTVQKIGKWELDIKDDEDQHYIVVEGNGVRAFFYTSGNVSIAVAEKHG